MANNRLYVEDTETGERIMLCKSNGAGWWLYINPEAFDEWINMRDQDAAWSNPHPVKTKLKLICENDPECYLKTPQDTNFDFPHQVSTKE